jgi:GNAT superfamily N-acetyltransferase
MVGPKVALIWGDATPPRGPGRAVKVRRALPGDVARLRGEAGAHYAALAPPELHALDGVDVLRLVAEVDGVVVSAVVAHIAGTQLRIDCLVTAAAHRGRGYAARLAEAAETWGRERGATAAEIWTDGAVAFWKGRMAYAERSVNLRKPLA